MSEDQPGERPRWSVTWLFRLQRVGRNRPAPTDGDPSNRSLWSKLFPWAVTLLLIVEIGLLVWIGVLPR